MTTTTEVPVYPAETLKQALSIYIGAGNSKTGPAFSLPEGLACPGKTSLCSSLCYGKTGRMNLPVVKGKRADNYALVVELLKIGGAELLASALALQISNSKAIKTKSFRIHDLGDFFSPEYVRAWQLVVQKFPNIMFWAYTRSWSIKPIRQELIELAALPNMALWASADADNWLDLHRCGIIDGLGMDKTSHFAGVAFMQTDNTEDLAINLQHVVGKANFINFPAHGNFGRILTDVKDELRNCPAVTKQIPHDKKSPACLRCKLCLPS